MIASVLDFICNSWIVMLQNISLTTRLTFSFISLLFASRQFLLGPIDVQDSQLRNPFGV